MYLLLALLAPLVMFLLIPGLAWFEDRMLGPHAPPSTVPPLTPSAVVADVVPTVTPVPAPVAAPTPALVPVAAPALRPGGHAVRSGRPRHASRPTPLDYRHHIARRRPPRAPVFR
ncbi:hypothetical protein [Streptomyces sp. SID3343]|uniref:hypothetical protein n=1 Tax=Streptomyces sp. SID3343 TaxID=2690260 RepID=UPI00136E4DEA|nr:hypothetical protein [Streptomyces sp. SID3343]MYW03175.1 hypothetical protein [Streptomyces sp. SID3343]